MVLAVFHEPLDRLARDRETLHLVEDHAAPAGNERNAVERLQPLQRPLDVAFLGERLLAVPDELVLPGKVDEEAGFVFAGGELADEVGLAHAPGAFDEQRVPPGESALPFQHLRVCLPFEIKLHTNLRFWPCNAGILARNPPSCQAFCHRHAKLSTSNLSPSRQNSMVGFVTTTPKRHLHFQHISNNCTPRTVVDYAPSRPAN